MPALSAAAATWKTGRLLPRILVAVGIVLRAAQYLADRSLWLDEACLATNILRRGGRDLLRPLDLHQAAPPGFLVLEKLAVELLGPSEYVFRLLPLLAGIAALLLFYRVATRTLPPAGASLAVALFALGDPLIYYASELKPYSVDVAVALVLLYAALWFSEAGGAPAWRSTLMLAIGGAAGVWLSYPVIFVLAGLGTTLAISAAVRRDRARLRTLVAIGLIWAGSFYAAYKTSIQAASESTWLTAYWLPNFMPLPPRSLTDLSWLPNRLGAMFGDPVGFVFRGLGVLTLLIGCTALYRGHRERLALLLSPLCFTLLGSGLRKYPFYGRLLLFLVPFLLLLVAEGAERLRALTAEAAPSIGVILFGLLVFHPAAIGLRFLLHPRTREEIKPVLAYIQERAAPGDGLYVYGGAAPAFDYYAPRYGFDPGRTIIGNWWREWTAYQKDLAALRGRGRMWFLLCHTRRRDGTDDEEKPFLYLVDGIGRRLESFHAPGAAAYLYDLGAGDSTPARGGER